MAGGNRFIDDRPLGLKVKQRRFKQGKVCAYCGRLLEDDEMTVDHIIPRTDGGDIYNEKNWQVLCNRCHTLKSHKEQLIRNGRANLVADIFYEKMRGLKELKEKYEKKV